MCVLCCQVSSPDGAHQVGKISKQWSGFVKEYFTDADNFGVSCAYIAVIVVILTQCGRVSRARTLQ